MANARSRYKETRSAKTQGRGRVTKKDIKNRKSPTKVKSKESKDEIKSLSKQYSITVAKLQNKHRATSRSLSDESKFKQIAKAKSPSKMPPTAKSKEVGRSSMRKSSNDVETVGDVANKKINKKPKPLNENFADILTKELTKKPATKIPKSQSEGGAVEPQIITMKLKTPASTTVPSTSSKAFKRSGKGHKKSVLPIYLTDTSFPTSTLKRMGSNHCVTPVESGGKTWNVPKQPKDPFVLPVSVEEHKPGKIEDMNVLRQMLKLRKIQLSNGVEISVPPPMHQTFECNDCGRCFRAKQDLRKHVLIHMDIRPHGCTLCNSRFTQRGNLKTHMTRMHAASLPAPEQFICHHCGARFFVKEAIRSHVFKHEPHKDYVCKHCPKTFARDVLLRAHIRRHHGSCRFYCYLCTASYSERLALDAHVNRHLGVRNLICHFCGKAFARLDCIRKHIASLHQDAKKLQCPICSKWLKGHLKEHMRTHVHSKPYACLDCGKRFAQTSQLVVHKRSHTGLKPYVCRVCKRPFTHSNALVLHIRIHTGEKPFECAMCPQAFSQLPHMKAHMLSIHNKKEAYKCIDCGEFFKLRATLDDHRRHCVNGAAEATPWLQSLSDAHQETTSESPDEPAMSISKMRFLLAILLQTIADENRLHILGFNKRLIDDLLVDSLEATGHSPCKDTCVPPARRLRDNIQLLLNWTVPPDIMKRFRQQNKTTEQLLEELTS